VNELWAEVRFGPDRCRGNALPHERKVAALASAATTSRRERVFQNLWFAAIGLLILNIGWTFRLGNVNFMEKALILIAGFAFLWGKRPDVTALTGFTLLVTAILVCAVLTPFFWFSWGRTGNALVAQISTLLFLLASPTSRERMTMLRTIAWIPIIIFAFSLVFSAAGFGPLFAPDHTGAIRLQGATIPAFHAAACFSGSIASAFLATQRDSRYLILLAATLLICLLTGSRMASACSVVAAGCIVLTGPLPSVRRLGIGITGLSILGAFLFTAGDQILIRFMSGSYSGREQVWGSLQEWIDRYPLTGAGLGHHGLLVPESVSRITGTVAAHNEYLRLLAELGYAGRAAFLAGLALMLFKKANFSTGSQAFCTVICMGTFFAYGSTDNIFYLSYAMFAPLAVVLGNLQPLPDAVSLRIDGLTA
jgi:O-antigen ligase